MEKQSPVLTNEDYERMGNLFVSLENHIRYTKEENFPDLIENMVKLSLLEEKPQSLFQTHYLYPIRNIELWEGFLLGVKIIIRSDGSVMIFVVAKTSYDKIVKVLEELTPKYTTMINYGCYMWRDTPGESLRLFEKIKTIDGTLRKL